LGRAVGFWASMTRHVQELQEFFGLLGLEALLDMLKWGEKFVVKLKEMTEVGRGIAAPMIFVSSIIRALVGGFGNAEQAAKRLSNWMDKTFSAENAAKVTKWIMYAVAGFHLMLAVVKSIGAALLFLAQSALLANPLAWATLGPKRLLQLVKDLHEAQKDMAAGTFGEFGKAKEAFDRAGTIGKDVKWENAAEVARRAMEDLKKAMGYSTDATNGNTAAQNAAADALKKQDKTFGGGERFARYSQALGYRMARQGFAPIQVTVNGSAAYQQGAKDGIGALADALSQQLAGQFPTGLAGSGA